MIKNSNHFTILNYLIVPMVMMSSPLPVNAQGFNFGGASGSYGTGQYAGGNEASVDANILNANKGLLEGDVNYENYLLSKRAAFADQLKSQEQSDNKIRDSAEERLRELSQPKNIGGKIVPLTPKEQAEAQSLMSWLKKDAEQRANNQAWLKRLDDTVAYLEQDQLLSVKNERNSVHNMFEDNLQIEREAKWRRSMAEAYLGLNRTMVNTVYGNGPNAVPYYGYGYGYGGYGYGGYGYGGRPWY